MVEHRAGDAWTFEVRDDRVFLPGTIALGLLTAVFGATTVLALGVGGASAAPGSSLLSLLALLGGVWALHRARTRQTRITLDAREIVACDLGHIQREATDAIRTIVVGPYSSRLSQYGVLVLRRDDKLVPLNVPVSSEERGAYVAARLMRAVEALREPKTYPYRD